LSGFGESLDRKLGNKRVTNFKSQNKKRLHNHAKIHAELLLAKPKHHSKRESPIKEVFKIRRG
jgi:hypothetical protein